MDQKPSIGRVVHYQSHGSPNGQHKSEPRAAVVTAVREDLGQENGTAVDLCVLNPTGFFFNQGVMFNADGLSGTWRWPPRV